MASGEIRRIKPTKTRIRVVKHYIDYIDSLGAGKTLDTDVNYSDDEIRISNKSIHDSVGMTSNETRIPIGICGFGFENDTESSGTGMSYLNFYKLRLRSYTTYSGGGYTWKVGRIQYGIRNRSSSKAANVRVYVRVLWAPPEYV